MRPRSTILPKWRSVRAFELYEDLKYAPGNTPPLPPREPTRSRRHRNLKLELADSEISRCRFCGSWTTNTTHCDFCSTNGYPVIDLGRTNP